MLILHIWDKFLGLLGCKVRRPNEEGENDLVAQQQVGKDQRFSTTT